MFKYIIELNNLNHEELNMNSDSGGAGAWGRFLEDGKSIEEVLLRIENALLKYGIKWEGSWNGTYSTPVPLPATTPVESADIENLRKDIEIIRENANLAVARSSGAKMEVETLRTGFHIDRDSLRERCAKLEEELEKIKSDLKINEFFTEGDKDEKSHEEESIEEDDWYDEVEEDEEDDDEEDESIVKEVGY